MAVAAWITQLLTALGAPHTATNEAGLQEWADSEGMPASANNPLAATDTAPSSTQFNSSGVQRYPNVTTMVAVYKRKLESATYANIGAQLKIGNRLDLLFKVINESPWCSGCQGGHYPIVMYQQLHGGTGAPPVQSGTTGTSDGGLKATSAMAGWNDLRHVVSRTLPAELQLADVYLRSALRTLKHLPKVK